MIGRSKAGDWDCVKLPTDTLERKKSRGIWPFAAIGTTTNWFYLGNDFGNFALLELHDFQGVRIWNYTGFLSIGLGNSIPNHLSVLGYPCFGGVNADDCVRMNITHGLTDPFGTNPPMIAIGGAMPTLGTTGGPWVEDWGPRPAVHFNVLGNNIQRGNTIRSNITSTPGASSSASLLTVPWDSQWLSLFNAFCARRAGNCT